MYLPDILDTSILIPSFDALSVFVDSSDENNDRESHEFKNFKKFVEKLDDIDHIIEIVRKGVQSKESQIFFVRALRLLHTKFINSQKQSIKKVYALIQLIVITSYAKDYKDQIFYSSWQMKLGREIIEDAGGSSLQEYLLEILGVSIGLLYSIPFKIITSAFLKRKLNSLRKNADCIIKELKIKADELLME